jgi:hypothetical protein
VPSICDQGILRQSSPRQQAGGPLSEDTIKCQLRPVERTDYPASLSAAEFAQLKQIFPQGVCDYAKPAVGWTKASTTWESYGDANLYDPPRPIPYPLARSA